MRSINLFLIYDEKNRFQHIPDGLKQTTSARHHRYFILISFSVYLLVLFFTLLYYNNIYKFQISGIVSDFLTHNTDNEKVFIGH